MADKSFGVKELNLLNASGTPTVTSPNNLNLNANTVAISTSCTIGNNLTVTSTTNSANLNVTGIGTLTRAFATDLSVSGVTTITVPANANPHSSWDVVNNSASSYRFTGPGQDGAEDNPNIYLVRGQRYVFKMNASGHPFQIRVSNGGSAYSDGVTNNGAQTGNVVFNVQHDAPAQLFYQCTSHGSMVGNIYIVGGPQVISGVVTATTFVGNLTGNVTGTASANAVLTGSTNNQLVTVTGANAITGEANLTFDGSNTLAITGPEGGAARMDLICDEGDDAADKVRLVHTSGNEFKIQRTTSHTDSLAIDANGNVNIKGGNLQVGTDSATVNFTNSNSTGTKFIEIGATGANSDSLLVVHSSGYGVGYFGFDAANERLIMATDSGGTHKIAFCLDAGTGTGGGNDNIGSATPALEIDNQKNINVGGIGTFGGGVTIGYNTTYSPIQQAANTYFYTRADQAGSVSGSNIQNLATGAIKTSETIPISNMTRQSDAGAHSFYNSSATSGSVTRNMSSGNPFAPKSYGLTMGTMFYAHTSGNNGSGVIHYGWTPTNHHFFVRYKYNSNSILVGADTDGSDVWTTAYQNDLMSDSNWYFFVVAVERNGTLLTSLNGAPLTPIRMLGTAPEPTDARFGLAGDGYADNDSRHRYATAFWYRGVISNELIAQEYAWLKTIWTGASLP